MSDLQLALIGAAIVAVALVWLYNLWQERKVRKVASELFRGQQDDVLVPAASTGEQPASAAIPDDRREPSFNESGPDEADGVAPTPADDDRRAPESTEATESTFTDAEPAHTLQEAFAPDSESAAVPVSGSVVDGGADEMCDCFAIVQVASPLSAAGVWAVQSGWSTAIAKPVMWLARSDAMQPWIQVDAASNARYAHWQVAVQLVDRRGAISESDLVKFYDGVSEFGRQIGVEIELPPRAAILQRAQQLDHFCAQVDVQFSVSIIHAQGGSFAGTKLRGMCEAAGLELAGDGRYHARNAAGETEFNLANLGTEGFVAHSLSSLATNGVTLTIDVPCVADGPAAFNRMAVTARQLANGLGGVLVDAQRTPLSDTMILAIRAKIDEIQRAMRAAEIIPGGARARRLFS